MSLADFSEKQILFIESKFGSANSLQFQNDNILYKKDYRNNNRISCYKVFAIFIKCFDKKMQKIRDFAFSFGG